MSLFQRKKKSSALPNESTQSRRDLMLTQRQKLAEAKEMARRASAAAGNLREENAKNHYIQRLEVAYGKGH